MKNTFSYSQEYFPPAPVVPVTLAVPEAAPPGRAPFVALIDTGADGTFVPTSFLEELGVPTVYMTNVRSHLGDTVHRMSVYKVDLIFFDVIRLPGMEVVGDDWGPQIILGRNAVNRLRLFLDGPNRLSEILE